ncbi:S66 peptidase family protein [Streptomyces fimicarius]|uniref:S66 peptidase family protein n=1 Tax=Streptomyces caviscabies TaxID=90079 RepID=A0ABW2MJU0_9ACTN|nr:MULTISPECIES: S66 peptidase family protein [Streptomyces]MCX4713917.1 LD-carboxypeptidase [Streptomyces griseus]MDX2668082.1 LD-carboxypeptidase [Streptomyces sp. NRRL_ISP-5395]MDX3505860.1 LD-carboxypeptidase [Streptomyces sp. ATCC51928]MDX5522088.1 LD-carboxypeptidase [Streptomyces sp. DE06-01C]QXR00973.1 LD-carboxypeptidase [Streptomyces sp. WY228]
MPVRYPSPLRPGDRIGITAPSSGVPEELRERLAVAVREVEARGYAVVTGRCMDGSGHASASAADRAAELTAMLTDPGIRAVVPPWGGETAIDLLPLLDWDRLREAEPTWVVGYSDLSTVMTPLTLLTGAATVHGNNLMDTPYRVPEGLVSWLDIVAAPPGHRFTQIPPERHRATGRDDYAKQPDVRAFTLDTPGRWTRLDGGGDVDVEGRLIGGCVEMLANIAGTPYLDTSAFARAHAPEGLLVYVEAGGHDAFTICRNLHGMRLAGFFDAADAVLVGRTSAPDMASLTQHQAVLDALGPLKVPIVADVECGHVQPFLPLVNGARARVVHTATRSELTQTLD